MGYSGHWALSPTVLRFIRSPFSGMFVLLLLSPGPVCAAAAEGAPGRGGAVLTSDVHSAADGPE